MAIAKPRQIANCRTKRANGSRAEFPLPKSISRGVDVSNDNVIPFRKRPPSETELEVYRMMTREWSSALRQLIFPEHFKREQELALASRPAL